MESGKTETVRLAFQPDEAKAFVGQVALRDDRGNTSTVSLSGSATPVLRVLPVTLLFGAEPRRENMSLTNLTNAPMKLAFATGEHLQPIDKFELAADETREVAVEVRPEVKGPVHETIVINGPRFHTPVMIEIPPVPSLPRSATALAMVSPSASPSSVAELAVRPSPAVPPPLVAPSRAGRRRYPKASPR